MSDITYKQMKKNLADEIKRETLHAGGYRIWIDKRYKNDAFLQFLKNIETEFDIGEIIKSGRNTLVKIDKDPDKGIHENLIIKRFNLKRKYDQLRFQFIESKAYRSLLIALALEKIQVKTPKPVAIIDGRNINNKLLCSYYISEYVPYDYDLKTVIKNHSVLTEQKTREYARNIAHQLHKIHQAGIIHNDLNVNNILIIEGEVPEFYFIDLNRARIRRMIPLGFKIRDLARIHFTNRFHKIVFCKAYDPQYYKIVFELMHIFRMRNKRKHFVKRTLRQLKINFR